MIQPSRLAIALVTATGCLSTPAPVADPAAASPDTAPAGAPGFYHGGPVIAGPVDVYFLWYGDWSGNDAPWILRPFIRNLGDSAYWSFLASYADAGGGQASTTLVFGGGARLGYALGAGVPLHDADLQALVADTIARGWLPRDEHAVYVILGSADVVDYAPSGKQFCTPPGGYGGYHRWFELDGAQIKYAFVGDPSLQPCSRQLANLPSPNGNPGADAMAAVIAHELAEAITDPLIGSQPAFVMTGSSDNGEIGDLCERSHGYARDYVTLGAGTYFLQPFPANVAGVPGPCSFDSSGS